MIILLGKISFSFLFFILHTSVHPEILNPTLAGATHAARSFVHCNSCTAACLNYREGAGSMKYKKAPALVQAGVISRSASIN